MDVIYLSSIQFNTECVPKTKKLHCFCTSSPKSIRTFPNFNSDDLTCWEPNKQNTLIFQKYINAEQYKKAYLYTSNMLYILMQI